MVASSKKPLDQGGIEQAVARALRDNLEKLQRGTDELHQAIADTVAACASSKATNALPPMLRAQTAAASLAASLDVLTRFVASALRPAQRSLVGEEVGLTPTQLETDEAPPARSTPATSASGPTANVASSASPPVSQPEAHARVEPAPPPHNVSASVVADNVPAQVSPPPPREPVVDETAESLIYAPPAAKAGQFDVSTLPQEEQELHRRANRVAKVSMQDIKMLRPDQVRAGVEHKDICTRLRDDISKAHKEYDRRFRPIMEHPVDYFYHWMVEILADGDPQALGDYPYSSPVRNR